MGPNPNAWSIIFICVLFYIKDTDGLGVTGSPASRQSPVHEPSYTCEWLLRHSTPSPYSTPETKASLSQTCTWQCQSLLNLLPRPQDSPGGQGLFPWSSQCTRRFLFLRMLGPNSTALPCVSCFYIHVSLHLLCPNCRMGLSPQLASLMSLPTDLPTPFTLLASQEQPGQGTPGQEALGDLLV